MLLVGVLILLGGAFVYWQSQPLDTFKAADMKEADAGRTSNQVTNSGTGVETKSPKTPEIADTQEIENSTIYYYGEECPHCKDVLAYFDENDIYNKVQFIKKEVWHNKANGEELRNAALKCGMNPANIGVPFVFSKGKCFMGGPDVMDFFAKEAGIEK